MRLWPLVMLPAPPRPPGGKLRPILYLHQPVEADPDIRQYGLVPAYWPAPTGERDRHLFPNLGFAATRPAAASPRRADRSRPRAVRAAPFVRCALTGTQWLCKPSGAGRRASARQPRQTGRCRSAHRSEPRRQVQAPADDARSPDGLGGSSALLLPLNPASTPNHVVVTALRRLAVIGV